MFARGFWKAAFERALKTFAQAAIVFIGSDATGLLNLDFGQGASVAGLAALVSVLTSVGSAAVTDGSPSLTGSEVTTDQP